MIFLSLCDSIDLQRLFFKILNVTIWKYLFMEWNKMKQKLLCVLLCFCVYLSAFVLDVRAEEASSAQPDVYRVVGNADWLGSWDPAYEQGLMTRQEDGSYQVTFEDIPPGTYEIKVTKNGTWSESWGDSDGDNLSFTHCYKRDVTVSFVIQDGVGVIWVDSAPASADEDDREKSPGTDDLSILPIMLLFAASLSAAWLLFRRKKYL